MVAHITPNGKFALEKRVDHITPNMNWYNDMAIFNNLSPLQIKQVFIPTLWVNSLSVSIKML